MKEYLINFLPQELLILFLSYLIYKKMTHAKSCEEKLKEKEISLLETLKTESYREKPLAIWVANHGLFSKVPVKEIEKKHHFQWKEDIFASSQSGFQTISWAKVLGNPMVAELQYHLNHTEESHQKIALKYFNEEMGVGVVAKEELNQTGKMIAYYAGKIKENDRSSCVYSMAGTIHGYREATDAYQFGNMSRFMMHLPNESDTIDVAGVDLNKVARANCTIGFVENQNNKIPVIIQKKQIKPNEVVGYSYGSGYWQGRSFWLVDKEGEKLAKVEYDREKIVAAR